LGWVEGRSGKTCRSTTAVPVKERREKARGVIRGGEEI